MTSAIAPLTPCALGRNWMAWHVSGMLRREISMSCSSVGSAVAGANPGPNVAGMIAAAASSAPAAGLLNAVNSVAP